MLLHGVLSEAFRFLKGPGICTISIKASMMKRYKILLYNKWAEEDVGSIVMAFQD